MVVRWAKQGLLLSPPVPLRFSRSHAALPTVDVAERTMYFSTRDGEGRSWIARGELDLSDARPRIRRLDPEPVLAPGPLGAFDDAGATPSCIVTFGGEKRLYYTGWSLGVTVPFYLGIGLAVSRDGGPFERVSAAPILGRTSADPYLTASPHVLHEPGRWQMWYVSCARWTRHEDGVRHHYHLRYGESADGIDWSSAGRVCVDFSDQYEYAFSRPCVLHDGDGYEMWYSVRGDAYRLGYARSSDGLSWERLDEAAGLDPSEAGWDANMIAYPHVFDHIGRRFMLYNGNGYGASGVGSAVRETVA
ncbi:MAG: glycoside hydrolase family protein [Solirubrobacteraceae bacterium]